MRRSDLNLTANDYTDPKLLDVAGAVEALPSLRSQAQAGAVVAPHTLVERR